MVWRAGFFWCCDFGVESLWDADGRAKALAEVGGGGTEYRRAE